MRTPPGEGRAAAETRGEATHAEERIPVEEAGLQTRAQGALWTRAGAPVIVDVPELSFLMVDGTGDPNTSRGYREGVEALFAVSYRVKFAVKRAPAGPTTGSCRWRAVVGR